MQKRVLLLPIIWGAYGLGEVYGLTYIFGSILQLLPFAQTDKPTSGAFLPALAFNVIALLAMIGSSLYVLGFWNIGVSSPKLRRDLVALGVLFGSLGLVFYLPIFVFSATVALVYLLATNIE